MLKSRIERLGIKRSDLVIGAAVGITLAVTIVVFRLGALGVSADQPVTIPAIAANAPPPLAPLTAQSSPQEVIALMLNSHTKWHTLAGRAVTLLRDGDNPPFQTIDSEIQVEQYGKAYARSGTVGRPPTYAWVSDGNTIWEVDLERGTYVQRPMPESVRSIATYGPPAPPPDGESYAVRHPLDGVIGSLLSSYIYPHGLAQSISHWKHDVVGTDIIAGRDTVAVLQQVIDDKGTLLGKYKYWIDARTGIILKSEVYGKQGQGLWDQQTVFTSIVYDEFISPETFTFQPTPGMKQVPPESPRP